MTAHYHYLRRGGGQHVRPVLVPVPGAVRFGGADHSPAGGEGGLAYIAERCSFRYRVMGTAAEARTLEAKLKVELSPALNAAEAAKGAQKETPRRLGRVHKA